MKKILALVLAVAMMATTAFAAEMGITTVKASNALGSGDTIVFTPDDFKANVAPNAILGASDLGTGDWKFSKDYFRISKKEIKKGSGLIASIDFDGENGRLLIKTVGNVIAPKHAPNLVLGTVSVAAKKAFGSIATGATYSWTPDDEKAGLEVIFGRPEGDQKYTVTEGGEYKNEADSFKYDMSADYLTLHSRPVAVGDFDVALEGRVYKNDTFSLQIKTDANTEVLKNEAYSLANLSFFQIVTSGLPVSNKLTITAPKESFVYEIKDKVLVAAPDVKWSEDDYAFIGKARTSREFVISDIELKAAPAVVPGNPETGANDVVGIAAALAVISLVAAGAVSLKK